MIGFLKISFTLLSFNLFGLLNASSVYDQGYTSMKKYRVTVDAGESVLLRSYYFGTPCSIEGMRGFMIDKTGRHKIVLFLGDAGKSRSDCREGEETVETSAEVSFRNPSSTRVYIEVFHPDYAEFEVR